MLTTLINVKRNVIFLVKECLLDQNINPACGERCRALPTEQRKHLIINHTISGATSLSRDLKKRSTYDRKEQFPLVCMETCVAYLGNNLSFKHETQFSWYSCLSQALCRIWYQPPTRWRFYTKLYMSFSNSSQVVRPIWMDIWTFFIEMNKGIIL